MRDIKYIVLHCTAGPQTQKVSDIQAYWKNKLGWSRPGYHHLISPDGTDNNLQKIESPTNGVAGYNANAIHISYIGGVKDGKPIDNRTTQQKHTMEVLVRKYHTQFQKAKILGHRDFSPDKNRDGVIQANEWIKACPSFSVSSWLNETGILQNASPPVVKKAIHTNSGSSVNVRKGPSTTFDAITQLVSGTPIIILEQRDGWSKISASDKSQGWVNDNYIK